MNLGRGDLTYVDTHAHLDDLAFDADREQVIASATEVGVNRIINVGYRPARWETTAELAPRFAGISVMLGLHPQHADEFSGATCDDLRRWIERTDARAVGEIGLDYYRDGPGKELQRRAFAAQLELAADLRLPVVIHHRAAEGDLMEVLGAAPNGLRIVLHSFEGTETLARFGLDRDYSFGVGGLMTRASSAELRSIIKSLPLDRLLLETDAPYLAPAKTRIRRNTPASIPMIADYLAALKGVDIEEVSKQTTLNAESVFGLRAEGGGQC